MTADAVEVLASRIDDLKRAVDTLAAEAREDRRDYVSQREARERNEHVDTHLRTMGREIGQLRADLNARRAPWWSVVAVALAAASWAWQILGPVLTVRPL